MSCSVSSSCGVSYSYEAQSLHSARQEDTNAINAPAGAEDNIGLRASSDYSITLSEESQQAYNEDSAEQKPNAEDASSTDTVTSENTEESEENKESNPTELTEEEQQEVEQLQDRHDEVVTHEQAHASVGGQYAGAPQYSYEQGPDGQRYATDGEVQIDVGEVSGDPDATIAKMEQVYRAALAPVEPSAADQNVAREAQSNIAEAKAEIAKEATAPVDSKTTEPSNNTEEKSNNSSTNDSAFQAEAASRSAPTNNTNLNQTLLSSYENSYTTKQSSFYASA
ncbi:putative metalloprotease CJM1_0395 family protein [Marinomonas balearica]|uniref:SprA family protein n=1 Tax=Marinomonas balearica TaxID=491947 RepID=A0A4R6M9I8_9GAMM|nr:putative metalloprotease CJM1_0395 family protein [Marinomonas balearica]TDO96849.1 SprA family protein [Marinomonas balearica]